jgi:hypothetical protein
MGRFSTGVGSYVMDSPSGHLDHFFKRLRRFRRSQTPLTTPCATLSSGQTKHVAPLTPKVPPAPGNFIQHLFAGVH